MHSWVNTTQKEKQAGLGLFSNNDASESPFGGLTNQVENVPMIGLTNAGGVAMARQNGDFEIGIERLHKINKPKDMRVITTLLFILTFCH